MSNVENSNGVNGSNGVHRSDGVGYSFGVSGSIYVTCSYGVTGSFGVTCSNGVHRSDGVSVSNGVTGSFGVYHQNAINKCIFPTPRKNCQEFVIFGKQSTEERYDEVWLKLYEKLNNWNPAFNNAFELYAAAGNNWEKVEASYIRSTLKDNTKPYGAWKTIPKDAIDYLKSLPEFDAGIFNTVTGIDVYKKEKKKMTVSEICEELGYEIEIVRFRDATCVR